MSAPKRFTTTVASDAKGRVLIPVPFDPDEVWGSKPRHHVAGTVEGMRVRGLVDRIGEGHALVLGAAWRRDRGIAPGDKVAVTLAAEGPQRSELAPDVAAALGAEPVAAAFFDSLAQFYRKAYLSWIDATKRRPDLRAARIAEMVRLLEAGHKQRPRA